MVVVICSMLILAVQTVELMLNINNVELMVLLVKNIIIGQVYMYLGFAVLLIVDHKNKQLRTDKLEDEIADIVVFDINKEWKYDKSESKSSNSPWLGDTLQGKIVYTICEGNVVYENVD